MTLSEACCIVVAVVALSACQTNTANTKSIKEADKTTVEFKTQIYIPPPRTISDLAGKLPAPEISPTSNLALRCVDSDRNGRWTRKAEEYLKIYAPEDRIDKPLNPNRAWKVKWGWQLHRVITISELRRGNLRKALESHERYIANIPAKKKGARISAYSRLAMIQVSMGNLAAADDAIDVALHWRKRAKNRSSEQKLNDASWIARARGTLAAGKGELEQAEQYYREAIERKTRVKPHSAENALARSQLAAVLAGQGRLQEAEIEARQALLHAIENKRISKASNAAIIHRLARILHDQGRVEEAERVAASSVWVFQYRCVPSDSVEFAAARRGLAETVAEQGRFDEALALYEAIEDSMGKDNPVFQTRFGGDLTWAYSLARVGRAAEARDRLIPAVDRLRKSHGESHPLTAETIGFLAIAEANSGDTRASEQHFTQAINILQDPGRRTGVRPHNLRLIIEAWLAMLSARAQDEPRAADRMFVLAEVLRGSSVQEAVSAMGARSAAGKPELAALLRREQDTRYQLAALETTFNNALISNTDSTSLKQAVNQLRQTHTRLLDEITDRFPDYAELIHPRPLSLAEMQQLLRPGEAFLSTYTVDDETYVWAISTNGSLRFYKATSGTMKLQTEVTALRKAFAPTGISLEEIPEFDVQRAYRLYQQLFQPLEDIWQESDTLFVVAHGPLGYLPLATLPVKNTRLGKRKQPMFSRYRDVPWWARSHAIATLPSAGTLKTLRMLRTLPADRQPLIGFGDPLFNLAQASQATDAGQTDPVTLRGNDKPEFRAAPVTRGLGITGPGSAVLGQLPRLPETAGELRDIARALMADTSTALRLGLQANEDVVKSTDLTSYRVVVFATHGLIPGDLDGLRQPALALTAPELAGIDGDGLLTMDEIMGLRLDADWVVLSACNTGSGEGAGAEAVSGLGKAFFYAGARSLLVSNWSVETQSAGQLTASIFSYARVMDNRALALRQSMVDLIDKGVSVNPDNGKTVFSYAHPIFWAPFNLVGDVAQIN